MFKKFFVFIHYIIIYNPLAGLIYNIFTIIKNHINHRFRFILIM